MQILPLTALKTSSLTHRGTKRPSPTGLKTPRQFLLQKMKTTFFSLCDQVLSPGLCCGGGRNAVATVTVAGDDVRVTEGGTETKEELKP